MIQTGTPSLACFTLLLNTLLPCAESMKYWDKNKSQLSNYQKNLDLKHVLKKPGRKRALQINEEFVLVLMRLNWDLQRGTLQTYSL